jgi:hypothetical protein
VTESTLYEVACTEFVGELQRQQGYRIRERRLAVRYVFAAAATLGILYALHGWAVLVGLTPGMVLGYAIHLWLYAGRPSVAEAELMGALLAMDHTARTMGIDGTPGTGGTTGAVGTGEGEGGHVH